MPDQRTLAKNDRDNWIDEKGYEQVKAEVETWPKWKKLAYDELVSDFRTDRSPKVFA